MEPSSVPVTPPCPARATQLQLTNPRSSDGGGWFLLDRCSRKRIDRPIYLAPTLVYIIIVLGISNLFPNLSVRRTMYRHTFGPLQFFLSASVLSRRLGFFGPLEIIQSAWFCSSRPLPSGCLKSEATLFQCSREMPHRSPDYHHRKEERMRVMTRWRRTNQRQGGKRNGATAKSSQASQASQPASPANRLSTLVGYGLTCLGLAAMTPGRQPINAKMGNETLIGLTSPRHRAHASPLSYDGSPDYGKTFPVNTAWFYPSCPVHSGTRLGSETGFQFGSDFKLLEQLYSPSHFRRNLLAHVEWAHWLRGSVYLGYSQ